MCFFLGGDVIYGGNEGFNPGKELIFLNKEQKCCKY